MDEGPQQIMDKDILVDIVRFWGVSRSISGAALAAAYVGWCSFLCLWRNYALMGGRGRNATRRRQIPQKLRWGERTTGTPKAGHRPSTPRATPGEVNEGEEREEGAFRIVNSWLSNFATADCGGGPPLESYMLMTFAPTLHRNRPR